MTVAVAMGVTVAQAADDAPVDLLVVVDGIGGGGGGGSGLDGADQQNAFASIEKKFQILK